MLTLNQIKLILLAWFNNHAQINTVSYLDDFDFNAESSIVYPVANIEHLNDNVNGKVLTYNFKIVIGDTAQNNNDVEDEIISDSILIAEDFLAYLQSNNQWTFNKSTTLNNFKADGPDNASGIVFTIGLQVIRSQNVCQTPKK